VYGRLSETYDAAESVPTQLDRGAGHARRRGWTVVATFKDDGYSAFKEITRDGFGELIAAIETGAVDVVIVRDIDRLTRNLTDWNAFEKACVRHGVRLSAYTGGDLDLSTAEAAAEPVSVSHVSGAVAVSAGYALLTSFGPSYSRSGSALSASSASLSAPCSPGVLDQLLLCGGITYAA
jgi:DNA invertase Pin-like site-specific DNA recombinase